MTPTQLRDFVIFRGQALRERLAGELDYLDGIEEREPLQKTVEKIERSVNNQAKARVYEGETATPDRPQ